MDNPMPMDEIRRQLENEKKKNAYEESRAKEEVHAVVDTALDTNKTLKAKLNTKLAEHLDNSAEIDKKIGQVAETLADTGLEAQSNEVTAGKLESENRVLEADYEKHKDEYLYHGIDHKIDKAWKRTMLLVINDIWFVIWAIVSFFTIVPVSTLLRRIKTLSGLVRAVAILVGVILGLTCLAGLTYAVLRWCGVDLSRYLHK